MRLTALVLGDGEHERRARELLVQLSALELLAPFGILTGANGEIDVVDGGVVSSGNFFDELAMAHDEPVSVLAVTFSGGALSHLNIADEFAARLARAMATGEPPRHFRVHVPLTPEEELPSVFRHDAVNLVVAPEDKRNDGTPNLLEVRGCLGEHGALGVVGIAGLWAASTFSPVADVIPEVTENQPVVRLVRHSARILDGGVEPIRRVRRALSPEGGWPVPGPAHGSFVEAGSELSSSEMARLLVSDLEWFSYRRLVPPTEKRRRRLALGESWSLMWDLTVSALRRETAHLRADYAAQAQSVAERWTQKLTFGPESTIEVRYGGTSAELVTTTLDPAGVSEFAQTVRDLSGADATRVGDPSAWRRLVGRYLALQDGSDIDGLAELRRGQARVLVTDPNRVVPAPTVEPYRSEDGSVVIAVGDARAAAATDDEAVIAWARPQRSTAAWATSVHLSGELDRAIEDTTSAAETLAAGRSDLALSPYPRLGSTVAVLGASAALLLVWLFLGAATDLPATADISWARALFVGGLATMVYAATAVVTGLFHARRVARLQHQRTAENEAFAHAERVFVQGSAEIDRLDHLYRQHLEWVAILSEVSHRPFRLEVLQIQKSAELPETLPLALSIAEARYDEDSLEGLASRAAQSVFSPGWMTEMFEELRHRSSNRLARLTGAEQGELVSDVFGDIALGDVLGEDHRTPRRHFVTDLRAQMWRDELGAEVSAAALSEVAQYSTDRLFTALTDQDRMISESASAFLDMSSSSVPDPFALELLDVARRFEPDAGRVSRRSIGGPSRPAGGDVSSIERFVISPTIAPTGRYLALALRSDVSAAIAEPDLSGRPTPGSVRSPAPPRTSGDDGLAI